VAGKKLSNEELHNLYSSLNIVWMSKWKRTRWVGHVAHIGKKKNAYRFLEGKHKGKKSLGRPQQKQENNIKWT